MFCMYCGKPTEGEQKVCAECAAARGRTGAPQSAPVTQKAQPFAEEAFRLNTPAAKPAKPAKAAKKSGKAGLIVAAVAAVVVVAILAVVLLAPGFFMRNFASPEDYLEHVEEKSVDQVADMVSDIYGMVTGKKEQQANGVNVDVHLQVGDSLLSGLMMGMTNSGMNMDLSWLKDIALEIDGAVDGDMTKSDIAIGLGSQRILTLSVILDMAEQAAWLGIPELNDTYLSMDLAEIYEASGMDMTEIMRQQEALTKELEKVLEKLPSEEVVNELLNKYIGIALSHIDDVEKNTKTMKVDDIKQELTEITAKIHEEDILEMAVEMLETLQDDKQAQELFAVIVEIGVTMDPYGDAEDIDAQEMLEDFIDEGLDALEDLIDDAQKSNYIKVKTYVNNSDEVVGRTVSISGQDEEISYITVWEDDEFEFEALLGEVEITGKGSREKGLIEATYVLAAEGMEVLTLEVSNWDEEQAEAGYLCGTLRLTPSEMLLDEMMYSMDYNVASVLASGKFALEVDLNMTEEHSAAEVRLMADRNMLLGITYSITTSEGEKVAEPADEINVIVDGMPNQEALQEWILDMDFDALLKNLRAAGVSSDLIDILESYTGMLEMYDTQYAG